MSKKFMVSANSYHSYLSYQYADNKDNLLLKVFKKYFTCENELYRKSFSLNLYERVPGTKGINVEWNHLKKYNYNELMKIASELEVKRLDRKYGKSLGFKLLDLYEIVYTESKGRISGNIYKFSFLIRKSHLDKFKNISFSEKEDKFIIKDDFKNIVWKLPYYKKNDYIDEVELPCMIRLF